MALFYQPLVPAAPWRKEATPYSEIEALDAVRPHMSDHCRNWAITQALMGAGEASKTSGPMPTCSPPSSSRQMKSPSGTGARPSQ